MWTAIALTALVLVGSCNSVSARNPKNGARFGYVESGDCEVTCIILQCAIAQPTLSRMSAWCHKRTNVALAMLNGGLSRHVSSGRSAWPQYRIYGSNLQN